MLPEDVEADPVEVWPENWPVVRLFTRLSGQWRVGMNGPTGLDYALPISLMERMWLDDLEFDEMLNDLNTLEVAALSEMNKKAE